MRSLLRCLALGLLLGTAATADTAHAQAQRADAREVTRLLTEVRTQLALYESQAHRRISELPDADTLRSVQQLVNQRIGPEFGPIIDPSPRDLFWAITAVLGSTRPVPLAAAGEAAYRTAEERARTLYEQAPADARAFRALAAVLLTRDRWAEVEQLALTHTAAQPADANGWLALGLAHARQRNMEAARDAFDAAIVRLSPAEWARLDRIERILPPREARTLARADSATREATAQSVWFLADPLWSSDDEQPRLEFLARVAYAELRWWEPEERAVGVDTDRGRIYVRYGPPDEIARVDYRPPDGAAGRMSPAGITFYWIYESGLVFAFTGNSRQSRQRMAFDDAALVANLTDREPARWDNIATRRIDSLAVQYVRFRAGADSTELFVATRAALERLSEVRGAELAARVWLIGRSTPEMSGAPLRIAPDGLSAWVSTVPNGEYVWRAEVVTVGQATAARATTPVVLTDDPATGYLRRGFGISDVLVGTATRDVPDITRWREAPVLPLVGALTERAQVALVWETYELAARDARAAYTVTVTLTREAARRRGDTTELSGAVVGALASTAGVRRGRDALTITYEREVAAAPRVADQLTLDLRELPAGVYRLTVEVRDRSTGRVTARETALTIADAN
jgi:GWxTD domain-containing protein